MKTLVFLAGGISGSVTIPDSVTSIGGSAFYQCTGLTSIVILDSVTSIDGSAFANCTGLTSVTIRAITPPSLTNTWVFDNTNDCPIYVPADSVQAYKDAFSWITALADRIEAIQ